jgi:hypothetical protein
VTTYSTFAVGRIRFVDGDSLSTDPDTRDDQAWAIVSCLAAGFARVLLDEAINVADRANRVEAVQFHSPVEGWELGACDDQAQAAVEAVVNSFFNDFVTDVIELAERIAWHPRWMDERPWHGDSGMGMYRVGMLLANTVLGTGGAGFDHYASNLQALPGHVTITDRLTRWVAENVSGWESGFIDPAEEPCLLHL